MINLPIFLKKYWDSAEIKKKNILYNCSTDEKVCKRATVPYLGHVTILKLKYLFKMLKMLSIYAYFWEVQIVHFAKTGTKILKDSFIHFNASVRFKYFFVWKKILKDSIEKSTYLITHANGFYITMILLFYAFPCLPNKTTSESFQFTFWIDKLSLTNLPNH